jgi:hypothetical protein
LSGIVALFASQMHDGNISKVAESTRRANMSKCPKLKVGTRRTKAFHKLVSGLEPAGATVVRRAWIHTDYDVLAALVRHNLMEVRYEGPRGGARWFTTQAGEQALMQLLEPDINCASAL